MSDLRAHREENLRPETIEPIEEPEPEETGDDQDKF